MKVHFSSFNTPNDFEVLPAITVSAMRCGDPNCDLLHGYAIGLHWGTVGISIDILTE